jgi:hypothetical protein
MKRLIFLKVEYLELSKKIGKDKKQEMRSKFCQTSIAQFKTDMKDWLFDKSIKITKEFDTTEPAVLIQFDEDKWCELNKKLISIKIVDVIDLVMSKDEA